jgi:hypothetical protein
MGATNLIYIIVFIVLGVSCSKNELAPMRYGIEGSWRLYEEGYSPGNGYILNRISANPLQSLTFTNKGELFGQGDNLKGYSTTPYYRVDSTQNGLRLHFLASRRDSLGRYMNFRIEGDMMRITPFCFEGCHLSFARIR